MLSLTNYKSAMEAALGYAGLDKSMIYDISANEHAEHIEFCFRTDFLEYDIFVEYESGFVAGFDTRPIFPSCEVSIEKLSA